MDLAFFFVKRREDHEVFDQAFRLFWRTRDLIEKMIAMFSPVAMENKQREKLKAGETRVSQALFDTMFDDFDAAMREMGVGDSGVGKKIRFMAEGFYGRAEALQKATATDGNDELQTVLARNVFNAEADDARAPALALYVNSAFQALQAQGGAALIGGLSPVFPAV